MKYFRWSHDEIMNMSWENYNMYLSSIPRYDKDDDDDKATQGITGSRNLFDFDKK